MHCTLSRMCGEELAAHRLGKPPNEASAGGRAGVFEPRARALPCPALPCPRARAPCARADRLIVCGRPYRGARAAGDEERRRAATSCRVPPLSLPAPSPPPPPSPSPPPPSLLPSLPPPHRYHRRPPSHHTLAAIALPSVAIFAADTLSPHRHHHCHRHM